MEMYRIVFKETVLTKDLKCVMCDSMFRTQKVIAYVQQEEKNNNGFPKKPAEEDLWFDEKNNVRNVDKGVICPNCVKQAMKFKIPVNIRQYSVLKIYYGDEISDYDFVDDSHLENNGQDQYKKYLLGKYLRKQPKPFIQIDGFHDDKLKNDKQDQICHYDKDGDCILSTSTVELMRGCTVRILIDPRENHENVACLLEKMAEMYREDDKTIDNVKWADEMDKIISSGKIPFGSVIST